MLKFRTEFLLETLSLEYIICMGLLRSYVGYSIIWQIMLMVVFLVLFLSKNVYRRIVFGFYGKNPFFWTAILLGLISIMLGTNNQYLFDNVATWLEVQFILCQIVMLTCNEKFNIRKVMMNHFYFLNFFWIVNLIILAIQCTGTGFMIKKEWLVANGWYVDHCSGLFGGSGTHRLSFFVIFMMVYNLYVAEESENKYRKKAIYIFTLATQLWMLYLSSKNDNKTLFALLPVFLLVYYVFRNTEKINEVKKMLLRFGKIIGVFLGVTIIAVMVLSNFDEISLFFDKMVIQSALTLATLGKSGHSGSIERLTIATDAISRGSGLLFGDGLGAAALSEAVSGHYRGYTHFSMSSIGTLVTLGGVWFYISYCLLHVKAFSLFINNKRRSLLCKTICFVLLVGVSIYTPIFENEISMLWLCFTFVMCGRE